MTRYRLTPRLFSSDDMVFTLMSLTLTLTLILIRTLNVSMNLFNLQTDPIYILPHSRPCGKVWELG